MHRLGLRYVVFNYELVFRGVYFSNSLLDIDCICLIMILTRERERSIVFLLRIRPSCLIFVRFIIKYLFLQIYENV